MNSPLVIMPEGINSVIQTEGLGISRTLGVIAFFD